MNDFYFGSEEWAYPMGHISFVGKLDGDTLKAGAPAFAPGWTLDLMAKHSLDFWLTSEDLPDPTTGSRSIADGGIVLSYTPNNEEGHKRLIAKLKELMKQQPNAKSTATNATRACSLAISSSASAFRWPGWRTRTARFASATIRGPARWTSTARPTSGQSLRRRRQLLLLERRGESGADDHGQRAAGGRPPD